MNDHALIVHSQSLCLNCAYSDGNVGFLKGGTTGKTTLRVGLVKGIILCLNHKKGPNPNPPQSALLYLNHRSYLEEKMWYD